MISLFFYNESWIWPENIDLIFMVASGILGFIAQICLLKYEITSIIVIIGSSTAGTPLGTNILKYLKPCLANPIIVTPMKINDAIIKVTMIWLVTVNEYGSMPIMLQKSTNINKLKINGK